MDMANPSWLSSDNEMCEPYKDPQIPADALDFGKLNLIIESPDMDKDVTKIHALFPWFLTRQNYAKANREKDLAPMAAGWFSMSFSQSAMYALVDLAQ